MIAGKIDEQLKSLCLPSLPVQVFHKTTVFNGFQHVSVSDVQRIIVKMPVKTNPLDCVPIILVKSCSDIFGDLLSKFANLSFTVGVLIRTSYSHTQETVLLLTTLVTIDQVLEKLAKG